MAEDPSFEIRALDRHCYNGVCHCDWRINIQECEEEIPMLYINFSNIVLSSLNIVVGKQRNGCSQFSVIIPCHRRPVVLFADDEGSHNLELVRWCERTFETQTNRQHGYLFYLLQHL